MHSSFIIEVFTFSKGGDDASAGPTCQKSPDDINDARWKFCVANLPKERRKAFSTYKTARDRCKWKSGPVSDLLEGFKATHSETMDVYLNFRGKDVSDDFFLNECEVRETSQYDDVWVIQRVGPFKGVGGFDWHEFEWRDSFRLKEKLKENPVVYITGKMGAAVDAQGDILGFPPIHNHHIHINENHNDDKIHKVLAQTHGDSQCSEDHGGKACLLEAYPRPYGFEQTVDLYIDGELNVARDSERVANDFGGEELEFYLEAAIRITYSKRVPIGIVSYGAPYRVSTIDQNKGVDRISWNALHFIPPNATAGAAMWYTASIPQGGRFLWNYMHAHQTLYDSTLVFKGSPESIGLNSHPFTKTRAWMPFLVEDVGMSLQDFRKHITTSAKVSKTPLMCFVGSNHTDWIPAGATAATAWPSSNYDRLTTMSCSPWTFEKGDQVTIVSFDTVRGHPDSVPHKFGFPQHSIFRGYVTKDGPSVETCHYIFGQDDPRLQWVDQQYGQSKQDLQDILMQGGGPTYRYGIRPFSRHN